MKKVEKIDILNEVLDGCDFLKVEFYIKKSSGGRYSVNDFKKFIFEDCNILYLSKVTNYYIAIELERDGLRFYLDAVPHKFDKF